MAVITFIIIKIDHVPRLLRGGPAWPRIVRGVTDDYTAQEMDLRCAIV